MILPYTRDDKPMNKRIKFRHEKDAASVLAQIKRLYGGVETATFPDGDGWATYWHDDKGRP